MTSMYMYIYMYFQSCIYVCIQQYMYLYFVLCRLVMCLLEHTYIYMSMHIQIQFPRWVCCSVLTRITQSHTPSESLSRLRLHGRLHTAHYGLPIAHVTRGSFAWRQIWGPDQFVLYIEHLLERKNVAASTAPRYTVEFY